MATKKFIIEVEEGRTGCSECPLAKIADCYIEQEALQICDKYNLATMKIKELEETNKPTENSSLYCKC